MYPAGFNASYAVQKETDVSDIEKTISVHCKRAGIWYTDDIAIVIRSQIDDMTGKHKGIC